MSDMDLVRGTLDVLVLKALTGGPMHGYGVARWIKNVSDDELLVEEGALYPALHRLAKRGWVRSDWGLSENNRRARFYSLTPEGRRALADEASSWDRYVTAVGKVLGAEPEAS